MVDRPVPNLPSQWLCLQGRHLSFLGLTLPHGFYLECQLTPVQTPLWPYFQPPEICLKGGVRFYGAPLVAQIVRNLLAILETRV